MSGREPPGNGGNGGPDNGDNRGPDNGDNRGPDNGDNRGPDNGRGRDGDEGQSGDFPRPNIPGGPEFDPFRRISLKRRKDLNQYPNVKGTGISARHQDGDRTDEPVLAVYVSEKVPEEDLKPNEKVPEKFENVPTDVREIGDLSIHGGPERKEKIRPMLGGVSVGHPDAGSGSSSPLFEDVNGEPVILTNRHVTADADEDTVGDDFLQPGTGGGDGGTLDDSIGIVKEQGPWDEDGVNTTDSALIDVGDAYAADNISSQMLGAGEIGDWQEPTINTRIVCIGRTTGLTSSLITDVDAYIENIDHGWAYLDYEGLTVTNAVGDSGDSGSLFVRVDEDTGDLRPVGLYFAGSDTSGVAVPYSSLSDAHGEFTPLSNTPDPDPATGSSHIEATTIHESSDDRGQLPVLVANVGGASATPSVDLSVDGAVVDTVSTSLSYAGYAVLQFDISSLPTGDQSGTVITPDETEDISFTVTDQTEYRVTVSVEDSNGNPVVDGVATLTDASDGTTASRHDLDDTGKADLWAEDGDYDLQIDMPDYDAITDSITISGSNQSHTYTATESASTAPGGYPWDDRTNSNPYDEIKYNYVGPQPLDASFADPDYPDRVQPDNADTTISTVSGLESAITNASVGETIWIESGDYDITGTLHREDLPDDVTIAGDGPRIYSTDTATSGIFNVYGSGQRFSGLRLEGPGPTGNGGYGLLLRGNDQVIDNCEVYNWPHIGIYLGVDSNNMPATIPIEPRVRHCLFRDCKEDGYGYPIAVYDNADPIIEYNYTNNGRHHIGATATDECAYRARDNLLGSDATLLGFEMHPDGGRRMIQERNESLLIYRDDGEYTPSHVQRGIPNETTVFSQNWCHNPNPGEPANNDAAITQTGHNSTSFENVSLSNNHYGSTLPDDDTIGIQELSYGTEETDNSVDLSPEVPQQAKDIYAAKPDVRTEYDTISAVDQGYDNRSGDLAELIEQAASNGQLVDLESGTFEMSSTVSVSSGLVGIVGDSSDSATVYYTGTSLNYLFSISPTTVVMEGATFDISEVTNDGFDSDVGLVYSQHSSEAWIHDIHFVGSRHRWQDLDGDGSLESVGGRFTFRFDAADPSATSLINECVLPDGGTDESADVGTVGHAIGPNADPPHEGYNVWRKCRAEGFMDNGFYVSNSDGPNIVWNCTAINNASGNIRLGNNDYVVGGYSEVSSLPGDRLGKPLEADDGSDITVIGLELYGEGTAYGNEMIQFRDDLESISLDQVVLHCNGDNRPARLSSTVAGTTVDITDCYWYDESTSTRTAVHIYDIDVTATDWRVLSENNDEIWLESSGSLTLNGNSISSGTYSASDLGIEDPQPFPDFYFSEDSDSDSGGGIAGDSATLRWDNTDWPDATNRNAVLTQSYADLDGSIRLGLDPNYPPLSDMAVGYWPLNDSGSYAIDRISGADGTINGAVTGTTGPNQSASMYFSGGDHIYIDATSDHSWAGAFAIIAVIRPESDSTPSNIFRTGTTYPGTVFLDIRDNNRISFGFYDSDSDPIFSQTFHENNVPHGEWSVVIASWDENELRVTLNGETETVAVNSSRPAPDLSNPSTDLNIGWRAQSFEDRPFTGNIARVAFCDRAPISSEESEIDNSMFQGSLTIAGKSP